MNKEFKKKLDGLIDALAAFDENSISATVFNVKMDDLPPGATEFMITNTFMGFKTKTVDITLVVNGDFKEEIAKRESLKKMGEILDSELEEFFI